MNEIAELIRRNFKLEIEDGDIYQIPKKNFKAEMYIIRVSEEETLKVIVYDNGMYYIDQH